MGICGYLLYPALYTQRPYADRSTLPCFHTHRLEWLSRLAENL